MKRIIFTIIVAIVTSTTVFAQEKGEVAAISALNIYANSTTIAGIGVGARYGISDVIRLESSLVALLKAGCSIDFNAEVQYLIPLTDEFSLYPLAGLSVNEIGIWSMGVKIGAGAEYSLGENWGVFGGVKWMIQTAKYAPNPVILNVGVSYKF